MQMPRKKFRLHILEAARAIDVYTSYAAATKKCLTKRRFEGDTQEN